MAAVYLWWIGEREPEPAMMAHVQLHVSRAFSTAVEVWDSPERPTDTLDPRRKQHASGKVLQFLVDRGPVGAKVVGITDRDLFIPILTFVFGEAQLGGNAAVVSTARLVEPAPRADARLFAERIAKECVHELGHAMGLVHCGTPLCAMGRSPSLRDVDRKSGGLCEDCRARLRAAARGVGS